MIGFKVWVSVRSDTPPDNQIPSDRQRTFQHRQTSAVLRLLLGKVPQIISRAFFQVIMKEVCGPLPSRPQHQL